MRPISKKPKTFRRAGVFVNMCRSGKLACLQNETEIAGSDFWWLMTTGQLYRPARSCVSKCVEKWSLAGDVAVWQVMVDHVMSLWFGKNTLDWNVTCPSLPLCCCLDCIEYLPAFLVSRSTFSENTNQTSFKLTLAVRSPAPYWRSSSKPHGLTWSWTAIGIHMHAMQQPAFLQTRHPWSQRSPMTGSTDKVCWTSQIGMNDVWLVQMAICGFIIVCKFCDMSVWRFTPIESGGETGS